MLKFKIQKTLVAFNEYNDFIKTVHVTDDGITIILARLQRLIKKCIELLVLVNETIDNSNKRMSDEKEFLNASSKKPENIEEYIQFIKMTLKDAEKYNNRVATVEKQLEAASDEVKREFQKMPREFEKKLPLYVISIVAISTIVGAIAGIPFMMPVGIYCAGDILINKAYTLRKLDIGLMSLKKKITDRKKGIGFSQKS